MAKRTSGDSELDTTSWTSSPASTTATSVPPEVGKEAATSSAPAPPDKRRYDRSIVEGPLRTAVWKIAWPTMLTNIIGGFQGIVDHALVGHLVGFTANAAIGVAWQIFIVVIVFISSLFTGMAVLVARFAGANQPEKVNRVVYQAFLTALGLSALLAAIGKMLSLSPDSTKSGRGAISPAMSCISAQFRIPGT